MKRRWSLLLLLCLLLTGCSVEASGGQLISAAEGSESYSEALLPFLHGYALRDGEDTLYAEISQGNAVACFDVQAVPAMTRGVGRYWYPHVSATVVLAVDRTRTDAVITGWNSLRVNKIPVGMSSFSVVRNMLAMGALSYGLDQKELSKREALDFLEHLCQNGGFELDGSDAPILICLDYEAAAWNRDGGTYEIIVPVEGTLSYRMGLLSDVPLTLNPGLDEALLTAGLPLAGGERPADFPEDYRSARTLGEEEYDRFLAITGDSSRDLRRQVFHARLYTTADMREHILSALLIVAAVLLWKGTVSHRMIRRDIRRVAGALGWLMVGWLLLRLFKYQLPQEGALCRMCWYGYYLFQLALPVALLYLTVILDRPEGEKRLHRPPVAASCGLCPLGASGHDQRLPSDGISLHTGWKLGLGLPLRPWILDHNGLLSPVSDIRSLEPASQRAQEPRQERQYPPAAVLRGLAGLPGRLYQAGAAGLGERSYGQRLHFVRPVF